MPRSGNLEALNIKHQTTMKRITAISLTLALLAGLLPALGAQEPSSPELDIAIPEGPKPWTSLELNNGSDQFQFAIVTDRTGGHRPGIFMEGVKRLNLLQPEFVMSVGDLIEGYTEDTVELNRQWDEFDGFVRQLEMPFFYVPGNHDITNKVMQDLWKKRLGPTHYYFIYRDVLFLCLDSEDRYRGASRGSISDEQYEWIKQTLAEHQDVRWTLLFMHQPLWLQNEDPVRWFDVENLLQDREHTVFVGHRHHYVKYERNNGNYFMLATTGGGSSLRGPELGEFDHVVWVTMTEKGPVIANLQLEGIWNEDVVNDRKYDFIETVQNSRPLSVEPLYIEGEKFRNGTVRLKLTNDQDVPMLVRLRNHFSWDLKSSLDKAEVEVAPNSVEFVELEMENRGSTPISKIKPLRLSAELSFQAEAFPNLKFPFEYQLKPQPRHELQPSEGGAMMIDGQLGEWGDLSYAIRGELGEADCSGRFDLRYDDDFLYFAARVKDDDLQVDTSTAAWRQDYLSLMISNDPQNISAMRNGRGWYEQSLYLQFNPPDDNMPAQSTESDHLDKQPTWKSRRTDDGYLLEMAIPIAYLAEKQGENWRTLRLNVELQDRDAEEEERTRISWQPSWRSDENIPGSGMLFRDKLN